MQKSVAGDVFTQYFKMLDHDESGELEFLEFLEFMRLIRDGEGFFSDEPQKLESQAMFLDLRILRRVLEIFRISKAYLLSMSKMELVEMFCDYLGIGRQDNLNKVLGVSTVAELFDLAQRKDALD